MAFKLQCGPKYQGVDDDDVSEDDINIEIGDILRLLTRDVPDFQKIFGDTNIKTPLAEEFHSNNNDHTDFNSSTCYSCAKVRQFKFGHEIKKGTHLMIGRYFPIDRLDVKLRDIVEKIISILKTEQPYLYFHHAIVSDVIETSDTTAKVKLVEFTSIGSLTFKIRETEHPIEIDIKKDKNIFYKHYIKTRYNADEIVQRARDQIGKSNYNIFSNNCEHLAVWCVSGEKESFQASKFEDAKLRHILSWAGTVMSKISTAAEAVFSSSPVRLLAYAASAILLSSVFILIELIFTIFRLLELKYQISRNFICTKCYNRQKNLLISKILTSTVITLMLLLVPIAGKVAIVALSIVLGIIGIFVLTPLFSLAYRKVKMAVNPLYDVSKMPVKYAKEMKVGDVLTIPDDHDVIVENVETTLDSSNFCSFEIVHFACRGLLKPRIVQNDCFTFELGEDLFEVINLDVNGELLYSDEEVVQNALSKIGNEDFNPIYYRSSHLSKMCKVRGYYILRWLPFNFKTTIRKVNDGSDVKPGDMVNFRYYGLPHVGIVVKKLPPCDVISLKYYHMFKGRVTCSESKYDLGKQNIMRHLNPDNELNVEQILENARRQLGKELYSYKPYKSSRFVKDCVEK